MGAQEEKIEASQSLLHKINTNNISKRKVGDQYLWEKGNKPFSHSAILGQQSKLHCWLDNQRRFMKCNLICITRAAQDNAVRIPRNVSCYLPVCWVNLVLSISELKGGWYMQSSHLSVSLLNALAQILLMTHYSKFYDQSHWYLSFLSINTPQFQVWECR